MERSSSTETLVEKFPEVAAALEEVERRDVVGRMWRGDHTAWKPDPTEISDRLGWLTVTGSMAEQAPMLEAFGRETRDAGYKDVVLLGMGGSSLGPEVLGQCFNGAIPGFPRLIVLDSTVPARVGTVTAAIDPARTLFLVSSKSGGTAETLSFYRYFRDLADRSLGRAVAGRNFVAITDGGTSLETMGRDEGFRKVFLNPPDLGGRYSVLSYFGLVPASLIGVDIFSLLGRANWMAATCAPDVPLAHNPGAQLGALITGFARGGRDKLTLAAAGSIAGFGLWVEQLIAESLGKEGKGVVPVTGEPLVDSRHYGKDRWFAHLRVQGHSDGETGQAVAAIKEAGLPVLELNLEDYYDLGAEFFRWEFATAVAGSLLGVNPFDQPDVQGSKDQTDRVLERFRREGRLAETTAQDSLAGLLEQRRPGDFLAVMAFIEQTEETDDLLDRLRHRVVERTGIATTLGYGPRFLHSTGQLLKGGPANGLFLQLTSDNGKDFPIPGEGHGFRVLAQAQALGDLDTLTSMGRRTARVNLGPDPEAGLKGLLESLD